MKKYFILCLIFLSFFTAKAFHYLGSEVTCKQLSGLTYHVTYKFYGDLYSGYSWGNNIKLEFKNNSTNVEFTVFALITDTFKIYEGVYNFNYSAIVTFPNIGEYTISYSLCCRIWSVNALGSGTQTFYNHSIITVDTVIGNSTPEFLFDPIALAPANDTLFYNPLPYDPDGDILLWSIDTPRMYYNEALINYNNPAGSVGNDFSINPKTGEITWIPVTVGHYLTAIKVEEYRNGIKIGEIIRDMVFIVENIQGNTSRAIIDTDSWSVDPANNFDFYLNYNQPFNLLVIASDANNNPLSVEAKGVPFLLNNNPAGFSSTTGAGYSSGNFSWTPTYSDINIDPYLVVFRIYEIVNINTLLRDVTIQLMVGDFTSINESVISATIGDIYPVPSSGDLFIPVNVEKTTDLEISFINQLGQHVKSFERKINTGQNLLYFNNLNLPSGIYFVNLYSEGKMQSRKIVIE